MEIPSHLLHYTLSRSTIPSLSKSFLFSGKVRDIYTDPNDPQKLVLIASDRVSAFDQVLPTLIPFKGHILNLITDFHMKYTAPFVPNALIDKAVDPNVLYMKKAKAFPVEFIIRGYLWGSLADQYEAGRRSWCGGSVTLPDGLLRYQKLDQVLFTPTTKAETGKDEEMSWSDVVDVIGKENFEITRHYAEELYRLGVESGKKGGLLFLDSKYEFGVDQDGKVVAIDEVNTPDSSRLCAIDEYEKKFPEIAKLVNVAGGPKTVTALLSTHPSLKMKEFSKQLVRDVLLEQNISAAQLKKTTLTPEQVLEVSRRYIEVYERVTGQKFVIPSHITSSITPGMRLIYNLQRAQIAKGCMAVILAGSQTDVAHIEALTGKLKAVGVHYEVRICSAHKQPEKLMEVIRHYNWSLEPLLLICCAGQTDALSGTVSFHSLHPSVSCPPDGLNDSCLKNPSGSSNAFIMRPDNVAKFALQLFGHVVPEYRKKLETTVAAKLKDLEKADDEFSCKD